QRGLDLAQPTGGDRGNLGKARPGGDLGGNEFLAAPGADDDIGRRADHVAARHDSVSGILAYGELRKHLDAASAFDEFRYPAEPGDHRLVPFLEIDTRPARQT